VISLKQGAGSSPVLNALGSAGLNISKGFPHPQPKLPEEISSLNDGDLTSLYLLFNEYNNFLLMQVSLAKVDADYYGKQRAIAEARFIAEAPKTETVAKTKARSLLDDGFVEVLNQADFAEHYATILEALQKTSGESMWVIKGELTRRRNSSSFGNAARGYTP
jgi:hypothetical protein